MKKITILLLISLSMQAQIKTINFKKDSLVFVKKGKKIDTLRKKVDAFMIVLIKDTIVNGKKGRIYKKLK